MKKRLGLFGGKTHKKHPAQRRDTNRRDDYYRDEDAEYSDEDYEDGEYDEEEEDFDDYEDEEFDREYGADLETEAWDGEEVDRAADRSERYEDDRYSEDDERYEGDRYSDKDAGLRDEEDEYFDETDSWDAEEVNEAPVRAEGPNVIHGVFQTEAWNSEDVAREDEDYREEGEYYDETDAWDGKEVDEAAEGGDYRDETESWDAEDVDRYSDEDRYSDDDRYEDEEYYEDDRYDEDEEYYEEDDEDDRYYAAHDSRNYRDSRSSRTLVQPSPKLTWVVKTAINYPFIKQGFIKYLV